jgi:hypothetical protein
MTGTTRAEWGVEDAPARAQPRVARGREGGTDLAIHRRAMTRLLPLALLALLPAGCNRSSAAPSRAAPAPRVARENREHDAEEAERRLPQYPLAVRVNGAPAADWRPEQVAQIPALKVQNKQGEVREAWALDDLAHKLVGPTAHVTALLGANDKRVPVDAAAASTLVLRVTRDGDYKAQSRDGKPLLHEVLGVELAR